ncbi:hypothetical protein WNY61_03225 [Sulfitobacter sp. AS92]|uniref:hypothetical protein n=1 Tax=Sulfitobacter sp. AS92 TaxID=3135783 RepID=UPI0031811A75
MWARIIETDGIRTVAEIIDYDPDHLPPAIAQEFEQVVHGMEYRAEFRDGAWALPPDPELTAEPKPEPEPQEVPVPLDYVRYVALVKVAGGLTAAVATSIIDGTHASDEVNFVQRLMERHSGNFVLTDPLVQQGLDTLLAEGVLDQTGRDAIEAAWPTG